MVKKLVITWRKSAKQQVRRLTEFRGIRRQSLNTYQSSVRRLYDGPRGAVLKYSSLLSLHEPLMGQLFQSGRFNASRFNSILDVGSGAGQIIRHLLRTTPNNTRIIGFDLSAEMLRRARERLKSDRPSFVAADMMHMPFRDASFDCITCGYVLEHLPDPKPGPRGIRTSSQARRNNPAVSNGRLVLRSAHQPYMEMPDIFTERTQNS